MLIGAITPFGLTLFGVKISKSNVSTSGRTNTKTVLGEKSKKKKRRMGYVFVNSKCVETPSLDKMKDHRS